MDCISFHRHIPYDMLSVGRLAHSRARYALGYRVDLRMGSQPVSVELIHNISYTFWDRELLGEWTDTVSPSIYKVVSGIPGSKKEHRLWRRRFVRFAITTLPESVPYESTDREEGELFP